MSTLVERRSRSARAFRPAHAHPARTAPILLLRVCFIALLLTKVASDFNGERLFVQTLLGWDVVDPFLWESRMVIPISTSIHILIIKESPQICM